MHFEGTVDVDLFAAWALIMQHFWAFWQATCFRNVRRS